MLWLKDKASLVVRVFGVDGLLLYQLANPNLHDIPGTLSFRVEMWDRDDQHVC